MMALGGAIGVGLVIGTGTALRQGGRTISARLYLSQRSQAAHWGSYWVTPFSVRSLTHTYHDV